MPSKKIQIIVIGKNTFQPSLMIWSYLYLGNVALSHKNIKMKKRVFSDSQAKLGIQSRYVARNVPSNGDNHPPKNIILTRILISIRFMYSARKNIANATPEYST